MFDYLNSKRLSDDDPNKMQPITPDYSQMYNQNPDLMGNQQIQQVPQYQQQAPQTGGFNPMAGMGWFGYAMQAKQLGQSLIPKDQYGNPTTNEGKAWNEIITPDHEHMMNAAKKGDWAGVARESTGLGKFGRMLSDVTGHANTTSGGWGKFNKLFGQTTNNNMQTQFKAGGKMVGNSFVHNDFAIVPLFPNGGVQYTNGGTGNISSEVEKQENSIAPDGTFTQFNGPSHEAGGIKTDLQPGELVFSDRLKHPNHKKTFAQLNKKNNTTKEDKILDDPKASKISKQTAELMKFAKQKNSLELFNDQEALKSNKVDSYIKRMGGIQKPDLECDSCDSKPEYASGGKHWIQGAIKHPGRCSNPGDSRCPKGSPQYNLAMTFKKHHGFHKHEEGGMQLYPWGGQVDASGFPIDATGRRLTPEEQMGFSNPNQFGIKRTYANTTPNYNFSLQDPNFAKTTVNKPLPTFVYDKGLNTTYDEQLNNYYKLNKVNLGSGVQGFAYGGKYPEGGPMIPYVEGQGRFDFSGDYNDPRYNLDNTDNMQKIPFPKYNPNDLELKGNPTITPVNNIQVPTTQPVNNKKQFNWKPLAENVANGLVQNMGNIYNLYRGQTPEIEKYQRATASHLDPTAALRDADELNRIAAENVKNASVGNSGNYLSNRVGLYAQQALQKDRVRKDYANINAEIDNKTNLFNTQLAQQEVIANAMNRAKARDAKNNALESMGSKLANQYADYKADNMDKIKASMIPELFTAIKNDPELAKRYQSILAQYNK